MTSSRHRLLALRDPRQTAGGGLLLGTLLLTLLLGLTSCAGETGDSAGDSQPASATTAAADSLPDWRTLWDFAHPAATETRFRAILETGGSRVPPCYRFELQTQIARTLGLQGHFDAAHLLLDSIAAELDALDLDCSGRIRTRYLLERGRALNSSGAPDSSEPLFEEALRVAQTAGEVCLAIDAAHMLGIVATPEKQIGWNQHALEIAEASSDPCALGWRGPLYHNLGMTHLEAGRFAEALDLFERDWAFRQEEGDPLSRRIAKWCVAHTLRRLGRVDEALAMQRELEEETRAAEDPDGYVYEEIAECLLLRGEEAEAGRHFARAYQLLGEDSWLVDHEPERLARLRELAESLTPATTSPEGESN